ncbi:hypothetical protein [Woodsholea maritima]|uniref:hypothetical protein n=1 Tax=Woodsholea maritima TaxID=240237 RepID=UPI00037B142D|nr:hypothetical protein [Woodsholea maritima]
MFTVWPNFKVLGAALGAGGLILIGGYGGQTWERARARAQSETLLLALHECQAQTARSLQDLGAREAALREHITQEVRERARREVNRQTAQNQYQEDIRHDPLVCPMDGARIERLHALAQAARGRDLAGPKTADTP